MDLTGTISDKTQKPRSVERLKYEGNEFEAKSLWMQIAKDVIVKKEDYKITVDDPRAKFWNNLLKYIHGDDKSEYDLYKGLYIQGNPGTGKTATIEIMLKYIRVNNIMCMIDGQVKSMAFPIISSREIVKAFEMNGFTGIDSFINYRNLMIDDLGSEIPFAMHFGTKLNVIEEVIEGRYRKNGFTFITSNDSVLETESKYSSRVYSRLNEMCTEIKLIGTDLRINKK